MRIISFFLLFSIISCTEKQHKEELELNIEIIKQISPTTNSLRGICVLDSAVVFMSGAKGTIIKTIDGGINWVQLSAPDNDSLDYRSIHAFSENIAIIVSAGFPARVYKTNNSGESWNLVYENNDSAAFLNSIAFKNQKEGIIMGDQLKGRHIILRTGNGGETWKRIDSIDVPKPLKVENAFAASGSCIAISKTGRFFIGFGGENTRIFSSANGFKWKTKTTPMVHGTPSSGIYSIAASGNGQIIAVGGDYTQPDSSYFPIISLDDGKSWVNTKAKISGYRSVIDYSQKDDIWLAGGTNGINLSNDHGENWSKISDQNINTLRFAPNSSKSFAGNSKGEILIIEVSPKN